VVHSQTMAFRRRVRDCMRAPPPTVTDGVSALDVVARMAEAGASAVVVVDPQGNPSGILTQQDVVQRIVARQLMGQTAEILMTRPVATVTEDQLLYEAIGLMRGLGLHHMPVVDDAGRLTGMFDLHEAVTAAMPGLIANIDRLTHESSLDGLREVKAAQVQLAADLFAEHVPAPDILDLVSSINNDIHRRLLALELAMLRDEGWGEPPVAFCTIVMGSGGRGESLLFPDQDHGFILEDYADSEHARIEAFFIELASRITDELDQLGFPRCRGGVMATNPVWRKTRSQWRRQLDRWMAKRTEAALLFCDILFDFRAVYGTDAFAEELRDLIVASCCQNPAFLLQMYGVQTEHRVGLGWFNRLLTERHDTAHKGEINLKRAGVLPLTEAVRLLALKEGIRTTGTLARLEELAAAGRVDRDVEDQLHAAFEHIAGLQLRQQIADYQGGRPVCSFVDPDRLTTREIGLLKQAFKAINDFRAHVRAELTGEIF
jgi:CBS domain-containing protein